jgi:hypothetical protein
VCREYLRFAEVNLIWWGAAWVCFTIGPKFRVISAWWGHSPGSEHAQLGLYCEEEGGSLKRIGRGELIKSRMREKESSWKLKGRHGELIEKENKSSMKGSRAHRRGIGSS